MLHVIDLSCGRGLLQILSGVTFSVAPGQAVIVHGANGAGKTTLLRTLAGLTPPLAGVIEGAHDRIAYAGHADGIKPQLTVKETLQFWAAMFGTHKIQPAIDAFDLNPLQVQRAGDMSAGQKRRLSLARLMVTGRPIWCLDEPTVSLDTENVARFGAVMQAHLNQGGSAVIATHIDLGLPQANVLNITPHIAKRPRHNDSFVHAFRDDDIMGRPTL